MNYIIIVELADFTKIFSHSNAAIGTNTRNLEKEMQN